MGLMDLFQTVIERIGSKQSEASGELFCAIQADSLGAVNQGCTKTGSLYKSPQQHLKDVEKVKFRIAQIGDCDYDLTDPAFVRIVKKNACAWNDLFDRLDKVQIEIYPVNSSSSKNSTSQEKDRGTANDQNGGQKFRNITKNETPQRKQANDQIDKYKQKSVQYQKQMGNLEQAKQNKKVYTQDFSQQIQNAEEADLDHQKSAKEILAELEEIHRKRPNEQKNGKIAHRSLNVRSRVIKINPELTNQLKEKRKKEAENKILDNIEFLKGIKSFQKKETVSFKEFGKLDETMEKLRDSIRIKTLKRTDKLQSVIGKKLLQSPVSSQLKNSRNTIDINSKVRNSAIFIESPIRLPPIETSAKKPRPYSIYNVNQKGPELYMNSSFMKKIDLSLF